MLSQNLAITIIDYAKQFLSPLCFILLLMVVLLVFLLIMEKKQNSALVRSVIGLVKEISLTSSILSRLTALVEGIAFRRSHDR